MPSKGHRQGGKISGRHTTIIPAAETFVDAAQKIAEVTNIALGVIRAGLKSCGGKRRVKISDNGQWLITLKVRDNVTYQEVFVHTKDVLGTKEALVRAAQKARLGVVFQDAVATQ